MNWAENGGERGNDVQQRAAGLTQTLGRCSEDTAPAHGAPALPMEPPGWPVFLRKLTLL